MHARGLVRIFKRYNVKEIVFRIDIYIYIFKDHELIVLSFILFKYQFIPFSIQYLGTQLRDCTVACNMHAWLNELPDPAVTTIISHILCMLIYFSICIIRRSRIFFQGGRGGVNCVYRGGGGPRLLSVNLLFELNKFEFSSPLPPSRSAHVYVIQHFIWRGLSGFTISINIKLLFFFSLGKAGSNVDTLPPET